MMSLIRVQLPSLQKLPSPIPLVVDSEAALGNAIERNLSGVTVLKCWNHVINAVKIWLSEHLKGTFNYLKVQNVLRFQFMLLTSKIYFISRMKRNPNLNWMN